MQQITGYRLSPQQRRLWRRQQADGRAAYRAQMWLAVEGDVQGERLGRAVAQVVSRHEILRTGFQQLAGRRMPLQIVGEDAPPHWETIDLRGAGAETQAGELERLWEAEARRQQPPEQSAALLSRLALLSDTRGHLFISVPALCADARTLRNLAGEISRAYSDAPPEPEMSVEPLQYADLSQWLNELFESTDAERGKDFWRGRYDEGWLAPAPRFGHQPPATGAFDAQSLSLDIDPQLSAKLRALPLYRSAPAAFLLACWQVMLWRLSACPEEVFVAVAHDGRAYEELRDALGLFTKYLPVGCRLRSDERLSEVVARAAKSVRETERWQEYFSWEYLGAGADAAAQFLPCGFDDEDHAAASWHTPSATFRLERLWVCTDRYALKLNCVRKDETLTTEWHYDGGLYGVEEVRRLARRYHKLLESVAEQPEAVIGEISVVGDEERRQQLVEWNLTDADYPRDRCVQELFEAQTTRTPDAVAVVSAGVQVSYDELNRRANRLAHLLRDLGVGPESLVGVLMERSVEMVVALLAVLKAGGAYVPLDTASPPERLSFMLEDSRAEVLLTHGAAAVNLSAGAAQVIRLDGAWADVVAEQSAANPERRAGAENLAYVIYTSGSTGKPKGAMITHRGLVNYLHWCVNAYRVAEGGDAPVHSSIGFDLTVTSLFSPLLAGRSVVLLKETQGVDALAAALSGREEEFSLIKITPAHLEMLNQLLPPDKSEARARVLVIGGEALRADVLAGWRDPSAGKRLINEYGPTETVVGCIVYEAGGAGEDASADAEVVPIGRPIANTQAFILDERMEPVPVGTPGELYIGGCGLARGYLNRADVTAEKFVPHPFARAAGARLYRSGDLARYLPDGNIEYLGRTDYQVKVRGYRIELGEIEACLREHEGVADAVVTLRAEAGRDSQLVGYVVGAGAQPATENELRRHLGGRLPEYMVPARVLLLKEWPLTANGKVDRRALPAPEQVQARAGDAGRDQYSLLEEMLADVWSHVLNVERVGLHDNFFDLGGHSLLAVRLISRLRDVFEVELTLDDIFEAQTLINLARRVESLIKDQRGVKPSPLRQTPRVGMIPLSFAQQRLWFLDQLAPATSAYNLSHAARLTGLLDVPALARTFAAIVARHESLRTTFASEGGRPRQVIAPAAPPELPLTDLSRLDEGEREAEVRRSCAEEAARPFDLGRGPLLRAALLRLSAREHVLLLTLHHIIADGWSMGVIVREVGALYEAYAGGGGSPLGELPIQYADYAVWQRGWLAGEVLEEQLSYWRGQLAGAPPVLELPTDFRRPATQSFRGATHALTLPAKLTAELKRLGRGEGVTLFMTLLAGFAALLSRYGGQSEVVVGAPIAGRTRAETEGLIGFFVNTLALRVSLAGDPGFRELLRRVREVTLGAYAHQDIPFEKLVEELQPVRDLSHSPLFQVAFVWNNIPYEASAVSGLEMTSMEVDGQTAKFDLTVSLAESADGEVSGDIEYVADLFEAATIGRMAAHFQTLLEAAAADPEGRLSGLPLLTDAERRRQLVEWNDTRTAYTARGFLHELFEAQAEAQPEAVAVVCEVEELTYAELNRRANQLAHRLRTLGVGPDVLVGVLMERSIEMVVALLAVLKAGGAYVPLDPSYPRERLSFMLKDSGAAVLLTQSHLRESAPEYAGVRISLDAGDEAIAREETSNPVGNVFAESLAYMIYTSGSTGKPKGAMNTHGAIRNRLRWMQEAYTLGSDDRVLQKTPFSFDVSVWELFWPLMNGARLVMARPGGHRNAAYLGGLIAEQQITTLHFVPSMLQAFLDEPMLPDLSCLRRVICSGEALSFELQERFFARLVGTELHNLYGPTEAAVDVTFWPCERGTGQRGVPIGRPIANTQIYILDSHLRPVPVGVAGELHIGGCGLARGYLNGPGLTAEKFIPDPSGDEAGARLYRTGDLARYRADGAIEFAGRIDYQVKIRGFRIELEEIEAVLCDHPSVHDAVVVALEDEAREKRLVAYVVAEGTDSPDAAELRRHLKRQLPEYMTPAAFVLLDELPLTASGKIDRRSLPAPERRRPEQEVAFTAPRTPVEERLCDIWAELLHVERVGVHDNFFELGGHSLLATQLVSRIRDAFLVELPLQVLFELPTIDGLTKAITTARAAQEDSSEVARMIEQLKQLSPEDVKLMLNTEHQ